MKMNRSTQYNSNVVQSMVITESALCPLHDPSFKTLRMDINKDIQILEWEVVLNDESQPKFQEVTAPVDDEANSEYEKRLTKTLCGRNADIIAQEV